MYSILTQCPLSSTMEVGRLQAEKTNAQPDNPWYGNPGCGVFKGGIQNYKGFWLKNNCCQMKVLNFENWSSGKLSKIGYHFRKQRDLKIDVIVVGTF